MKDLNLIELYRMKKRFLNENIDDVDFLNDILEAIEYKENLILEDTRDQLEISVKKSNNSKIECNNKSNIKKYDLFLIENYNKQ